MYVYLFILSIGIILVQLLVEAHQVLVQAESAEPPAISFVEFSLKLDPGIYKVSK